MVILGIESSAQAASAAVVKDGKLLSEMYLNVGLTHSVTLMPLISSAVEKASLKISDIDGIAVSKGPGSFTGVRIGIATAKGLAQPYNIKCIPVSTLETIAYPLIDSECIAAAVMDARCSQVYCALFDCRNSNISRLTEDNAVPFETLLEMLKKYDKKTVLIGDGTNVAFEYLKDKRDNIFKCSPNLMYQKASSAAFLGEKYMLEGTNICSPQNLVPDYLRPPQAERELKRKKEFKE
ncbi:MAG: tRNA (adenosine(37)-N6)-threonylcarbamoyltransferase complex dimerization subunit type 1 TsaB [Clostridiales bacterium]|nr:tRNA (adenosine(37)-N6)-threonylcarbamoyltransferase complex dimerization subunit type 1 TsaB [Clostridiales bacterium]